MDIELKLREMLVLRDPGVRFTDNVLSRVGDVPNGQSVEGVVRIADARTSRRGRRVLLGSLVVVAAAAAALPFMLGGTVHAPMVQEAEDLAEPAGGSPAVDTAVPVVQSDPSSEVATALDCIDPDVLLGLLLTGQTFRMIPNPPQELAAFKPPRQLIWLGGTERGSSGITQVAAVYHTQLAPDAARVAAVGALVAGGWKLQSDNRHFASSLFVSASSGPLGETWCREGRPVSVTASALDGVTYVVLSATRTGSAGLTNDCDPSAQAMFPMASPLDDYMPTLELPRDPATGQPVAIRGGGGGTGGDAKRRANVSFQLKDSVDSVAGHFASQLARQGWQADTNWSGAGTAGSTWTRRLNDNTVLQAMLAVSAFADDRFTAVFRVASTK